MKVFAGAAALLSALLAPATADAGLVLETEAPVYSVGPTGMPQATVRVFLIERAVGADTSTPVTNGGGLYSYGFRAAPQNPPSNPVRLIGIESNPGFTPAAGPADETPDFDLTAGTARDSRGSNPGGVGAETPNRFFLATLTYSLQTAGGGLAATTTFQLTRRAPNSDDFLTATGPNELSSLDSQVQPGTFTITAVPEPTAAAAIAGLAGLGLVARRRRALPA